MPVIRLQKILSAAGVSSRRASETMILEGRVTVNGETVSELGSKADPERDDIRVDGRRVKPSVVRRYILMYKPRGYITSRSDPQQRPTVIDLLAKGGVREYVYPVGRLDYDSEGLLLLTSDGALAAQLMHPRHALAREYHVRVRGVPDHHALERLAAGVVLDGRRTAPAGVELLQTVPTGSGGAGLLSIVIHEGRNRQVRRMCEAVGHPVVRLRRVRIGPIADDHIRPGEFRDLDPREVAALRRAVQKGDSHHFRNGDSHLFSAESSKPRNRPKTGPSGKKVAVPFTSRPAAPSRTPPGRGTRGRRPSGRPRRG